MEYELYHHGIKGQKWGVRRYQNADGSLTSAGKKRYITKENVGKAVKSTRKFAINEGYKIQKHMSDKEDAETMASRKKNRQRIEDTYSDRVASKQKKLDRQNAKVAKQQAKADKTAAKIDALNQKKAERIKDFDEGTKLVKAGMDKYNKVLSDYRDARLTALEDRTYRKTPEFKSAVKNYVNQSMNDAYFGGTSYSKLVYSFQAADENKKR